MGFAVPTPTDEDGSREYFRLRNHTGRLVTIKVIHLDMEHVNPKFKKDGPKPYVWGDVTILDGDDAGTVYPRAEISGQEFVKNVKSAIDASPGELVLGRITRGDQGGRPFFLNPPDADDINTATEFFAGEGAEDDPRDESTDDDTPPWER